MRQNQLTTAPMMDHALFIVMSLIRRDRAASATVSYCFRRALRTGGKLGIDGIAIDGTCTAPNIENTVRRVRLFRFGAAGVAWRGVGVTGARFTFDDDGGFCEMLGVGRVDKYGESFSLSVPPSSTSAASGASASASSPPRPF
jgi:hypothetical protein